MELNPELDLIDQMETLLCLSPQKLEKVIYQLPMEEQQSICKSQFDKFYSKKKLSGSLSSRVSLLDNEIFYLHIVDHCFDGIDIRRACKEFLKVLNPASHGIISQLHYIDSEVETVLHKYVIYHIISRLRNMEFDNERTNLFTRLVDGQHVCTTKSKRVENKCKMFFEGHVTYPDGVRMQKRCRFPKCQNWCYAQVKNPEFSTEQVITELFTCSTCYFEQRDQRIQQRKIDNILSLIGTNRGYVRSIERTCDRLVKTFTGPVFTNLSIGTKNTILSDFDLIMGNCLICVSSITKSECSIILQQLGCVSLLKKDPRFKDVQLDYILVLNPFKNTIRIYNIQSIEESNLTCYLDLLMNIYDPEKPIEERELPNPVSFPF